MFSLKQETKIGGNRAELPVALVPTRESRVRIGTCVLDFSGFFTLTYTSSFSLSPPALLPSTLRDCHR